MNKEQDPAYITITCYDWIAELKMAPAPLRPVVKNAGKGITGLACDCKNI